MTRSGLSEHVAGFFQHDVDVIGWDGHLLVILEVAPHKQASQSSSHALLFKLPKTASIYVFHETECRKIRGWNNVLQS